MIERPDVSLAGRVAVITGGGAGIGRAIAIAFAAAGADIVIAESIPERCEEVSERVRELGRQALAPPTDVSETAQVAALIAQAEEKFGRIDILVNNAGGTGRRPFVETSERSWRRVIDLNLVSMLAATSAAVPVMIRGGRGGAVINVSSIEASRAAPRYAVYSACKAAMNNFTRTLAVELSEHGIRVNAIAPDFTDTPGLRGNVTGPVDPVAFPEAGEAQRAAIARRIPLGRGGVDSECANAALFLASSMSSYITGAILPVDGGAWASGGWLRDDGGQWILPPGVPRQA